MRLDNTMIYTDGTNYYYSAGFTTVQDGTLVFFGLTKLSETAVTRSTFGHADIAVERTAFDLYDESDAREFSDRVEVIDDGGVVSGLVARYHFEDEAVERF